jgi:4-hydroxybenzoate polyprenyltransferase
MRPSSAALAAVRLSRPHLWTYTLGAAFLAALVASESLEALAARADLGWFALWLAVPAGWLIYGLNDAFDAEADVGNARKMGLERVRPFSRRTTLLLALAAAALYVPIGVFLPWAVSVAVSVAAVSTYLYSAPPLRAKGVPFLDGLIYLAPPSFMLAGYAAVTGFFPPWPALVIAWAFSFAMHLYSAAIDADADRVAGIQTVAVRLGSRRAIVAAAALAAVVSVPVSALGGAPWGLAALAYAAFFVAHLARASRPGFAPTRWYAAFLALHFLIGTALSVAYF